MDLTTYVGNGTVCDDVCKQWDAGEERCVDQQCFMDLHSNPHSSGKCNCTLLSQQAVTTVGLVMLFVLLGVVLLVGWRCQHQPSCCVGDQTVELGDAAQGTPQN